MPSFIESRLRKAAAAKGKVGKDADQYVYGAMNNQGLMKGNKVVPDAVEPDEDDTPMMPSTRARKLTKRKKSDDSSGAGKNPWGFVFILFALFAPTFAVQSNAQAVFTPLATAASSAPSYTSGSRQPLSLDLNGNLRITAADSAMGAAIGTTSDALCPLGNGCSLTAQARTMVVYLASIDTGIHDTTPVGVYAQANTTGGTSGCYLNGSAANTNPTSCKAAAAAIYGFDVRNSSVTAACLRLYNLAVAPTASSATGFVHSYLIPAASSATSDDGGFIRSLSVPLSGDYTTGLGFVVTGGVPTCSSTDATAAPTGIQIDIQYK